MSAVWDMRTCVGIRFGEREGRKEECRKTRKNDKDKRAVI